MVRNDHDHQFTCTTGKCGKTGCRMCVNRAHPVPETLCAELRPFTQVSATALPRVCAPDCYTDVTRTLHAIN